MMRRRTATIAAGALLALAIAQPGAAQVVTRGPYLQIGSTSSIVVRWRTDVPTDSRVQFGTTQGAPDFSVLSATMTTEHAATLSGLAPETRYYYSVGTLSTVLAGGDATHYFNTSPPTGAARATRVWVIGDSGTADQNAAAVRDSYLGLPGSENTDLWLMLGDNAYTFGTDLEYQAAVFDMFPMLLKNTVVWPTRGNHDLLHDGDHNDYYEIFSMPTAGEAGGLASGTEAYYSFDYANIHFVCLDSQGSDRSVNGPMMTWLAQDLAATAQDWIIAFWHHPPYSKGSHNSDTEQELVLMRENALPILEAGGVDLVLTGHSHSYERSHLIDGHYGYSWTLTGSMILNYGDGRETGDGAYHKPTVGPAANEGTVYTVAGSSGQLSTGSLNHPAMYMSAQIMGSLILEVDGNRLDATFININGGTSDWFTIVKGVPVSAGPVPSAGSVQLVSRPNPFGHTTRLDYQVPSAGRVELSIYDVRGHRVRELVARDETAGDHTTWWDGRDARGGTVAQGVYFAVLDAGGQRRTQRLVLVR